MLKLTFPPEAQKMVRAIYPDGSTGYWHLFHPDRRSLAFCLKSILGDENHEILPMADIVDGEVCMMCWPWDYSINKKEGKNE